MLSIWSGLCASIIVTDGDKYFGAVFLLFEFAGFAVACCALYSIYDLLYCSN